MTFYLSDDDVIDPAVDTPIATTTIGPGFIIGDDYEPFDDMSLTAVLTPSGLPTGAGKYIGYWLDSGESVSELEESNNFGVTWNTVEVLGSAGSPDLSVMALDPDIAMSGGFVVRTDENASIVWPDVLARNTGSTSAGTGVVVKFYVTESSAQAVNLTSDTEVGSLTIPEELGAGVSIMKSDTSLDFTGIPAGSYWMYAYIDPPDPTDAIVESDENNNDSTNVDEGGGNVGAWIQLDIVTGLSQPDIVAAVTDAWGYVGGSDATCSVELSVMNVNDNTGTGPSVVEYWLSTDNNPSIGGGDIYLMSEALGELGALISFNTEAVCTRGITVDTEMTYYYKIQVDALNEVTETDEGNVFVSGGFMFEGGEASPELSGSIDSYSPIMIVGEVTSVDVTFYNNGNQDVGLTDGALYLSDDMTLDGSDQPIGGSWDGSLLQSDFVNHSFMFTVPDRQSTGYLILVIDESDSIAESNEGNNIAVSPVSIAVGGGTPNLMASGTSLNFGPQEPSALRIGDTVTAYATISETNSSPVTSPFDTGVYLSWDPFIDTFDTFLASDGLPSIAGAGVTTLAIGFTVPDYVQPQTYYLGSFTDCYNTIAETEEGDNGDSSPFTELVSILPANVGSNIDLWAKDGWSTWMWNGSPQLKTNAYLRFNAGVESLGALPATTSVVRMYFATDSMNIDPGNDYYAGEAVLELDDLISGDQIAIDGFAPPTEGTYYTYYIADGDDAIAETTNANNMWVDYQGVNVVAVTTAIDLEADEMIHPDVVSLDEPFYVSVSIIVSGQTQLDTPVELSFYLSEDDIFDPGAGDPMVATTFISGLPVGADIDCWDDIDSGEGVVQFSLDSMTHSTGTYYLFYKLDSGEDLSEMDEENNVGMSENVIVVNDTAAKPDLGIMIFDPEMVPSRPLEIIAQQGDSSLDVPMVYVFNRGGADTAGSVDVTFYATSTQNVDIGNAVELGSFSTPGNLPAGYNTNAGPVSLDVSGLAPGVHWIYAYIDPANAVDELDEANNDSTDFTVYGFPGGYWVQLTIQASVTTPDLQGGFGEYGGWTDGMNTNFEGDFAVMNVNETVTAGPSAVSVWLSTDNSPSVSEGDTYLGSQALGQIEGLYTKDVYFWGNMPVGLPTGVPYYYKVKIDSLDEVTESNESNNFVVSDSFMLNAGD